MFFKGLAVGRGHCFYRRMPETLSDSERAALAGIQERVHGLTEYLRKTAAPSPTSPLADWLSFLAGIKSIVGNSDNDSSLVASLMARHWLCSRLQMRPYDAVKKSQNAPGLDIDELTLDGRRVVAEIKTTEPYQRNDFGAAQLASVRKDFTKLNAVEAGHRFFFVTTRRAFDVVRAKYAAEIPLVTTVLLTTGETFTATDAPAPNRPPAAPEALLAPTANPVRPAVPITGRTFPLVLQRTYLEKGFFNVTVDFDVYVRPDAGPISMVLCAEGKELRGEAKVNRTANGNSTARIMGGVTLRDWLMRHFDLGARLDVHLLSPHEIRIEKAKT